MGYASRILFIKYYELTNHTQEVLDAIHDFIGEPKYEYDLKNVQQRTEEWDGIYNYKFLHKIREGEIKYKKGDFQVDEKFANAINQRFVSLNKLILEGDPSLLLGLNMSNDQEVKENFTVPEEPKKELNTLSPLTMDKSLIKPFN